jgi:nicotinamide mononucleotide transporter
VGCVLFGLQFFRAQLYADATLQLFFIATSLVGWRQWDRKAPKAVVRPITRSTPTTLAYLVLAAVGVTAAYGHLLHRYTDAYLPYVDSAVMALSVVAQCLLMLRKLETWPWWLAVNTLSVPLFASRGLWLTAGLYAAYWFNAGYGWWPRPPQRAINCSFSATPSPNSRAAAWPSAGSGWGHALPATNAW